MIAFLSVTSSDDSIYEIVVKKFRIKSIKKMLSTIIYAKHHSLVSILKAICTGKTTQMNNKRAVMVRSKTNLYWLS